MNKVALVTGGTRGIGLAIAKELAQDGYDLAVVATRERQEALEAFQTYSNKVIFIYGDISQSKDRKNIIDTVMATYGRIDVLVNNAGVAPKERKDILSVTEESMDFVMGINLKGTFFLTQLVANKMIEQAPSDSYRIINISSLSAYTTSINRGEYCISKAGMSMVTSLFADRLAQEGIKVYEVRPGIIKTDMTAKVTQKYDKLIEKNLTPIKRWGYPEDVASVVSLLCSPKMRFSTGDIINVDGGFHIRRL